MENQEFSYLLFLKINRSEILKNAAIYIENQDALDQEEKRQLQIFSGSFINFLTRQMQQQKIDKEAFRYWVQVHHQGKRKGNIEAFSETFEFAVNETIKASRYSKGEELYEFTRHIIRELTEIFQQWIEHSDVTEQAEAVYVQQLDAYSMLLIQYNGTEDLAILLTRAEEIFHFKRSIFLNYNPWLNEFSGVLGRDLPKVQRMQGNIEGELVFAMKKPIFLKKPEPYIQQVAIDLFQLASIIFIPVKHEQQLFGWMTFDQMGQEFDCTKAQLDMLEQVGNRLGMYLARKQLRSSLTYQLHLSEKEQAILYLLAEGYNNKEMGKVLYLSEFTVRDYIQKLQVKLQAKNRTQIVSMAFRMGVLE